jgi:hypothetical protein
MKSIRFYLEDIYLYNAMKAIVMFVVDRFVLVAMMMEVRQ